MQQTGHRQTEENQDRIKIHKYDRKRKRVNINGLQLNNMTVKVLGREPK